MSAAASAPVNDPASNPKRERCSVTIITCNEEANLRTCLESVTWADEVVIVDSGSTDRTLAIARDFTDKIFINQWPGMREQKNFAAEHATHPWVLNLDADERVSEPLRDEIVAALSAPAHPAYAFARRNIFLGRWMRHGGWYPDEVLRLYRKDCGRFGGVNPHCAVELARGTTGHLHGDLVHFTYRSFAHYISKQFPYSDAAAREIAARRGSRRIPAVWILSRTIWKFIEAFILKRGFLDGVHGLIAAMGSSFAMYMKLARLWELGQPKESAEITEMESISASQPSSQETRGK